MILPGTETQSSGKTSNKSRFATENSLVSRKAESARVRAKYPDRIPIVLERAPKQDSSIPDIDKNKYLVPGDLTVGQFMYVIRKRIRLTPDKAIFVFINNVLPTTSTMITDMYDQYHDEDGFLYLTYSGENTFGTWDLQIRSKQHTGGHDCII